MIVSMLPLDIVEANPAANIAQVEKWAAHLRPDADVLVLPELFSTGFVKDEAAFSGLAEPMDGFTLEALRRISERRGIGIAGSFLCRENDGSLRNRAFFIDPDKGGLVDFYDKRHLFTLSPEHLWLKAGEKRWPVVEFRNWRIALSICFDIRFPVWNRNVDNAYDMMIVPANWPDSRYSAWKHLMMARAIENMAVMVGCNRSGFDEFGSYSYLSTFGVDERGTIVAEIHGSTPLRHASFNLERLREFREKYPVYLAADKFTFQD